MAGVDIDLIVRDVCRLRPGLRGRQRDDRRLQRRRSLSSTSGSSTSRAGGDDRYYIGSADWMTKLDNRVETIAPINDPRLQRRLNGILETLLGRSEPVGDAIGPGATSGVGPRERLDERPRDVHAVHSTMCGPAFCSDRRVAGSDPEPVFGTGVVPRVSFLSA